MPQLDFFALTKKFLLHIRVLELLDYVLIVFIIVSYFR